MTLAIGIVGAGRHGARYARHASRDVPGMTVAAICRRDRAAGEALAGELTCAWHADGRALIDDPAVVAVVIATPPSSHLEFAAAALAAGKPILLEKPATGTLAESRRLCELARRPGAPPLMVAQTLRWNPVLQRARQLWPELGQVHLVRLAQRLAPTTLAWQRDPDATVGGSVLLTGVHLFDLARWLTGREFVSVSSRQRSVRNPVVEDLFLAHAELDDGCWASFEVSKYTPGRAGWLEAVGDRGQLHVDYLGGRLQLRCGDRQTVETLDGAAPTLPQVLGAWRDVALGLAPVPVSAVDGLRTLAMVDGCYRSAAADGATVMLGD